MSKPASRLEEWKQFEVEVFRHIRDYTIPQYGDMTEDMASTFSKGDIDTQLKKYVTRQCNGGNKRGRAENMRDYLKIAHYACIAYMKMKNEEQQTEKCE